VSKGYYYKEYNNNGSLTTLAAVTIRDIKKALKTKLYLTEKELKDKLPSKV